MPELPEVATIVTGLARHCQGRTISEVKITGHRVFRGKSVDFDTWVNHQSIQRVSRHGKFILIHLSNGRVLLVHLGMTGRLLWRKRGNGLDPHTHFIFRFPRSEDELRYVDIRRFGWMEMTDATDARFAVPDAWEASMEEVIQRIREKTGMIKHGLLNQSVIAGLGNIYVDESLYRSKIHPKRTFESLSPAKAKRLVSAIRDVLKESIDLGGTSVRNYVDLHGGRGGFKGRLLVYGKEGTRCRCGSTIRKVLVAGRGTHFCPRCQR